MYFCSSLHRGDEQFLDELEKTDRAEKIQLFAVFLVIMELQTNNGYDSSKRLSFSLLIC
jgi:hypothetical protein